MVRNRIEAKRRTEAHPPLPIGEMGGPGGNALARRETPRSADAITVGHCFSRSLSQRNPLVNCIAYNNARAMAYTFAHLEIHSRKGGKSGSTSSILDEAERVPGASPHVPNPAPPEVVYGMTIEELRHLHDRRAEACHVTQSNGRTRKIRSTQNTLATVVMSFPDELATADPAAVKDWERLNVAWLKAEYGERLKTVVRHVDEGHPHLHAYLLDDGPEMRASSLHPGFEAKAAALAAGATNKAGDRAYRDAMRLWQDRYWEAVGLPCGLARIGPARRRLTRRGWRDEQDAVKAVATARKAAQDLKGRGAAYIDRTRREAAEITATARAQAAQALKDHQAAATALQAAERSLRTSRTLGGRLGALWAAARAAISGRDQALERKVREEEAAKHQAEEEARIAARATSVERKRIQDVVELNRPGPRPPSRRDSDAVTWHGPSPRPKG